MELMSDSSLKSSSESEFEQPEKAIVNWRDFLPSEVSLSEKFDQNSEISNAVSPSPVAQIKLTKLRLYLDIDETLVSVKTQSEISPEIIAKKWHDFIIPYLISVENRSEFDKIEQNIQNFEKNEQNGLNFDKKEKILLFVKIREGVLDGIKKLSKHFDIVICSTGENYYIEKIVEIICQNIKPKPEIVAAKENKGSENKSIHRPKQQNADHCLALDNLNKWMEPFILLDALPFDFWEHAVSFGAKKEDNFWPVFQSIALAISKLILDKIVQSTEEAIVALRKTVFWGKKIKLLTENTILKSEIEKIILEHGGILVEKVDYKKFDIVVIVEKINTEEDFYNYVKEIPWLENSNAKIVQLNYITHSRYQLWPAKEDEFCFPKMKFFSSENLAIFDCLSGSKPVDYQARFNRAKEYVKNNKIEIFVTKNKLPSYPMLISWFYSRFRGQIKRITRKDLEEMNDSEKTYLVALFWNNPKVLRHFISNGFNPNFQYNNEPFAVHLIRSSEIALKPVLLDALQTIDLSSKSKSGKSLLAIALTNQIENFVNSEKKLENFGNFGKKSENFGNFGKKMENFGNYEIALKLLSLPLAKEYFKADEKIHFCDSEMTLLQFHQSQNRNKMDCRTYQKILSDLSSLKKTRKIK